MRLIRRRPSPTALLTVIGLASVLGIAACGSARSDPPPLREGELPAEAFVNSIGVAVHLNYTGTTYERQAEIVQRLRELGVRHIRDAMPSPGVPLATGLQAVHRAGLRATLTTGDVARRPDDAVSDSVRIVGRDGIEAFEGPNELDNSGNSNWKAILGAYMPALAAAVHRHAAEVPVIGPSFVHPGSRGQLSSGLPGLVNGHPYPGGEPPEPALGAELDRMPEGAVDRGVVFTETGYHNALRAGSEHPPASEQAAAVYLPRLLLTAFGAGVRRTFVYELADVTAEPAATDPVQHFGLLRSDLSPKPAFQAIRTLLRAVRNSPGGRSSERPPWRLAGDAAADVERLTLVRGDGSRVLALWRPVSVWDRDARRPEHPKPSSVEVVFGSVARDVVVWRPSVSPSPVLRRASARRLPLELEGEVVLVSLR